MSLIRDDTVIASFILSFKFIVLFKYKHNFQIDYVSLLQWKEVNFMCWLSIIFCIKKPIKETEEMIKNYYRDSALLHGAFHWNALDHTSTNVTEHPEHPNEIINWEMVNKIYNIVLNYRQVKIRKITKMHRYQMNMFLMSVWIFWYENIIGKMGAAFAHSLLEKTWWFQSNISIGSSAIQVSFWSIVWKMYPLLHLKN